MAIALKRLKRDIKIFDKIDECKQDGIFAKHSSTDIKEAYAMIIGPEGTPYEGGFFCFKVNFPSTYPFNPPTVKYLTQGSNIRFNPNLYTNGKVCLSILGTWSGPKWTSIYNLKKVLISLQGQVMVENPLNNEPGYTDFSKSAPECKNYNSIVSYGAVKHAIIDVLEGNLPVPDEYKKYFQTYINEHFVKNYSLYVKRINDLKQSDDKKTFQCSYQRQSQKPDYTPLLNKLGDIFAKLCK